MAAKKKKKASARAGATKRKKKASKAAKAKRAPAKKSKARKAAKRPAKKARKTAKAVSRKAPAKKLARAGATKKKTAPKKKQTVGEGDYAASKSFLKDQSSFVERNKTNIPAMGQAAEKALDGPEGDALRAAEADGLARSRDTF